MNKSTPPSQRVILQIPKSQDKNFQFLFFYKFLNEKTSISCTQVQSMKRTNAKNRASNKQNA